MDIIVLTSTYPSIDEKNRRVRAPDFIRKLSIETGKHCDVAVIAPSPLRRRKTLLENGVREEFFPFSPIGRSSLIGEGGILERLRGDKFLLWQVPLLVTMHLLFSAIFLSSRDRVLIHAHWLVYCGFVGWVLKRFFFWKDIRLVVTIHGSDSFFFRVPFVRYLCRAALRSCNAITCVNSDVADSLPDLFGVTAIHMPMGVPEALFESASDSSRIPKRILFVGRVVVAKGLDRILAALPHLDGEFHLVIAGDGPYLSRLAAKVRKMGLEERVIYLGWVDERRIKVEMAKASCLVLPSDSEGFSLTVLEAMASGLPVVGNDIDALNAQLRDGRGYPVEADNPLALAEAIKGAERGDEGIIKRARGYAQQYRWESVGKGYKSLYDDVWR